MKQSQDTALRYLEILRHIPEHPGTISTPTLLEKLSDNGFIITERTLQRDLKEKLSAFPITLHHEAKPFRWGYTKGARLDLKALDTPSALALNIAEEHLNKILPKVVLDKLQTRFKAAEQLINAQTNNNLSDWKKRVRAIPNGKSLIPASISEQTWSVVTESLLYKKQINIHYKNLKGQLKQWRIHPQGLVSRHSASYLIVTINDYQDLKILALHRIQTAQVLPEDCKQVDEKTISDYIDSGELGWGSGAGHVQLVAEVSPYTAGILNETKLSLQQTLTPIINSDWHTLIATVPNNKETLW